MTATLTTPEADDWKREQARSWLHRIRGSIARYNARRADLAELLASADGIRAMRYDAERSGTTDPMRDRMVEFIEREGEYLDALEAESGAYLEAMEEAHRCLRLLDNPVHDEMLTLHYVSGHTWTRVADEIGYSESHVYNMLPDALLASYAVMPAHEREPRHSASWE